MTEDITRRYLEIQNALGKTHDVFLNSQRIIEQLSRSTAVLAASRNGFIDSFMNFQQRLELADPLMKIQRIVRQMQSAQEMADNLGKRFGNTLLTIENQANRWRNIIEPSVKRLQQLDLASQKFSGLADSLVAWESTASQLTNRFAEIGLLASRVHLSARLFATNDAFTTFAHNTIERIESTRNEKETWALELSLQVAEEQLISTTETLEMVVAIPTDDDEISESRDLTAPFLQQSELIDAVDSAGDYDDFALLESSPAIRCVDLSRSILTTITTCNEARKVAGAEEIFKPTTKLLEVYSDLPWLIPADKHSFAQFVDCLYFLFYEGAGKDNLRFMKSNGGPIPDGDFDFILCIKHLRNKWTRHDADHGKDVAIRKAWAELASKFQMLGVPHMPVTPNDFRMLHANLLTMAHDFVGKILHGIVGTRSIND